jgi:L-serine deaminase
MTIAQLVYENELFWRTAADVRASALNIWAVMEGSIREGITSKEEFLPGHLRVRRRARNLHQRCAKSKVAERRTTTTKCTG